MELLLFFLLLLLETTSHAPKEIVTDSFIIIVQNFSPKRKGVIKHLAI